MTVALFSTQPSVNTECWFQRMSVSFLHARRKGDSFRVAAYQARSRDCTFEERLAELIAIAGKADAAGVDVLTFPECFLTGYFPDEGSARQSSIEIDGLKFSQICKATVDLPVTVIVGFTELLEGRLYNASVVIENGRSRGIYRKSYLCYGYHSAGREYPVFSKNGVLFGVVICLDSFYMEPCRILARKGAKVIFCPMDNRVSPEHRYSCRPSYYSHIVARSFENNCWFVSADVVLPNNGTSVCPGHTFVYDNEGVEASRSKEFSEELLIHDIPMASLTRERPVRLFGNPDVVSRYIETELKQSQD